MLIETRFFNNGKVELRILDNVQKGSSFESTDKYDSYVDDVPSTKEWATSINIPYENIKKFLPKVHNQWVDITKFV